MSDRASIGVGDPVGADLIDDIRYQRIKLIAGAEGANDGDISNENPLPVVNTVDAPGIWQFADTDGDGGGTIEAIGDYSAGGLGLTEFAIAPGAGEIYRIARLLVTVTDTGSFDSGAYGNNVTLANGIEIHVRNGTPNGASTLVQNLTGVVPIITNTDWAAYCYDLALYTFGAGPQVMVVRWTFSRAGVSVVLDGDAGDYLAVRLFDDFTDLDGHVFNFQGIVL